jgi:hypothetical protein
MPVNTPTHANTVLDRNLEIIQRRSREYLEHVDRWNFLLDSLEGGNRYRFATYGEFPYEFSYQRVVPGAAAARPERTIANVYRIQLRRYNLIRHPREYPDPRDDAPAVDPFELRRERTPVPPLVQRSIEKHLSRIYAQEVGRTGPDQVVEWWKNVDGCGTNIDHWMQNEFAPMFLVLGQMDLVFDHPQAPPDVQIMTKADERQYGLDKCVVNYYLPENVLWWKLFPNRQYSEVLVRELVDEDSTIQQSFVRLQFRWNYRHWRQDGWTLYSDEGIELDSGTYSYGRPPIVRIFDRKKPRCKNVGQSRYESIAERQREVYNLSSEQILGNTTQAFPMLQGPEKYLAGDNTIPVGPERILPIWSNKDGTNAIHWSTVNFPKDGMEFIQKTIEANLREADREAALSGSSNKAVSAAAMAFDFREGNDLLSSLAAVLNSAERLIAQYALWVMSNGEIQPHGDMDEDTVSVTYPRKFDLQTADEVTQVMSRLQQVAMGAGTLPSIESEYLKTIVRLSLPGRTDAEYEDFCNEIDQWVEYKHTVMPTIVLPPGSPGIIGPGGGGIADKGGTDSLLAPSAPAAQIPSRSLDIEDVINPPDGPTL